MIVLCLAADATGAFKKSESLWCRRWTAAGLMARLAFCGIVPHPATTPPGWNARVFVWLAMRSSRVQLRCVATSLVTRKLLRLMFSRILR